MDFQKTILHTDRILSSMDFQKTTLSLPCTTAIFSCNVNITIQGYKTHHSIGSEGRKIIQAFQYALAIL